MSEAATTARIRLALEGATAVEQGLAKIEGSVSSAAKAVYGLAGGLSAAGFATWIKGAINSADETAKLAQKTGLAVSEVAGLQLAFRQSGASAEQFVPIMAKLGVAVTNGSKALDAMGVSTRNADGSLKSTRQVLGEVADKFAGYQNGAQKTALAVGLLGEEGAKLLPFLNQGAEGLENYDEMARQLGLTLDEKTAKAAEQFNDTIDLMGQSTAGVARQVAAGLLPTLNTMAGELLRNFTQGTALTTMVTALSAGMKGLYSVAVGVVTAFRTVGTALGGVGAAIAAVLSGDFSAVKTIVSSMASDISASWQSAGASIQRVWAAAGDETVAALAQTSAALKREAPVIQQATAATNAKATADRAAAQALRERIAAAQSSNAAFDEEFKRIEDARTASEGRIRSAREMLQSIERETLLMGMSNDERERAVMLWDLERSGVVAGTEAYAAFIEQLDDALSKRRALRNAQAAQEAGERLRQDELREWQRTWGQVSQSFTDALMAGGKSVAQYLKGLFRTLVLRPILAPVGAAMASLLSGPAAAAQGGSAGGLGSLGSLQNLLNPSKIFSSFGDSLAFAADSAGQWLVNNTSGMLNQLGGNLMGNAGTIGTLGSYAGGAMAGIGIGRTISGGYSAFGSSGNTAVNAGTIIGSIFGGAIGGAIGGLVNRAFGRKAPVTQSQGISGTFSEAGANVQQYQDWFAKGGWFRSDKSGTNYSAVSAEMDSFLDAALAQVASTTRSYAQLMSLNADAINGITQSVKINLQGLNAQQQEQAIADALAGFGSRLAQELLGTFETTVTQRKTFFGRVIETSVTTWVAGPFVRAGETAGEALQRLGMALGVTNQVFDTLGTTLFDASLQGADFASQLVDVFGGLENLQAATAAYYQAFYSDAERLATGTRQMGQALQALGLAVPSSRDGFRALVEAQDLTTEAGRSTYAALMGLAPAFAELTQTMEQLGSAVGNEVRRLRGLLTSDSSASLAALQAQFATGTAMARAGDTDALARLPELSQAIEAAAALQAVTAADVALMRGQLAASLGETLRVLGLEVPAFEVGTNYVPKTMLAQVHEGEAIVPRAYNPAAGGSAPGGDALARRVDDLVTELRGLRDEVRSGVTHSAKTARILDRVARDGNAFVTVAEA